jgi:hypothetical protein
MRRPQPGGSDPADRGVCLQAETPAGIAAVDSDARPLQGPTRHQAAVKPRRRRIPSLPGGIRDGAIDISVWIRDGLAGNAEPAFALQAGFEQLRVHRVVIQLG